MSAIDLVGIVGDVPKLAEVFTGISASLTAGSSNASPPISDDVDVSAAIWAAQSGLIEEESAYLAQLNEIFKGKYAAVPKKTNILIDLLAEIVENVAGKLAYLLVLAHTENLILSELAGFAVEVTIEKAIEGLRSFLQKGQALCYAITAENNALLTLESNLANYELRREAMKLHTEQIENILLHIRTLEQQILDTLGGDDWEGLVKDLKYDDEELLEKLSELSENVSDLKYNDQMIDLGGLRVWLKHKVIEYG